MKFMSFVAALLCCSLVNLPSSGAFSTDADHEKLCRSLLLDREWGKLTNSCKLWFKENPKNTIPLALLAIAYENHEQYRQSSDTWSKKNELERTLLQGEKAWDSWVENLVKENPESAVAHFILGALYSGEGKFQKAIDSFRKTIQLDPSYASAYSNLAGTLVEKEVGRFNEAITYAKKALEIHPNLAPAWCNLGLAYGMKGMPEQEASAIKKSVEYHPDFAAGYYNLGTLLYSRKKYQEAENAFRKAVGIHPIYCAAWYNLGHLYLNKPTPENDKAIVCLKHAINADPSFPDAYIEIGVTYKRKGMYSEAIDAYKKYLSLRPDNPIAYFNLGVSYYRQGQQSEAKSAFKKASDLDTHGQVGSLSRKWLAQIR
ncbi:tetratricopeptide repeat protein [bacterium]|nr:tetratricopeptide repeat protein [bacterium]